MLDRFLGAPCIEGRTIHVSDVLADPEYRQPDAANVANVIGVRAGLGVPLMREGNVVGVLTVVRNEPRAFSQKQIELIETFADQAVIAIENVRLFDEVQARTDDLSEALEQQTAISDILEVITFPERRRAGAPNSCRARRRYLRGAIRRHHYRRGWHDARRSRLRRARAAGHRGDGDDSIVPP